MALVYLPTDLSTDHSTNHLRLDYTTPNIQITQIRGIYSSNCTGGYFLRGTAFFFVYLPNILTEKLVRQRSYWRRSGEYVQRHVCFVNIQSSLHENVVFSVCLCLGNAAYIIFIMMNSISSLHAWYHIWLNTLLCCGCYGERS